MKKFVHILRNVNVSNDVLNELLSSLGYGNVSSNPNERISDELFAAIIDICNNGNLLSVINLEFNISNYDKEDINLDEYNYKVNNDVETSFSNSLQPSFWVDELYIRTKSNNVCTIKLSDILEAKQKPYFSVLIGTNGVGKSSILRDIVNFFIEIENQKNKEYKRISYKGLLLGIKYHIDNIEYCVVKAKKSFIVSINRVVSKLENLKSPIIVACHYGAFDKFPRPTINGAKASKYDIPIYKYVGAYVNGNVISTSSILFRLLFILTEEIEKTRVNICSILDFINYETKITLQYSIVSKSKKNGDVYKYIAESINLDKEYREWSTEDKLLLISKIYNLYKIKSANSHKSKLCIDFKDDSQKKINKNELNYLYKLKQYNLINSVQIWFYRNGERISSEEMSSGELVMLSAMLSISAAACNNHTLILFDEPELSQHPNWQMSLIENLDKALFGQKCHTLLATHSHMLVSDLPISRSSVIQLEKTESGELNAEMINSSTYGWSAEEVLFKVFKTATDRNRYFGERIANLLFRMGNNTIIPDDVTTEINELARISGNLSDIDPMKSVLKTIIQAYKI